MTDARRAADVRSWAGLVLGGLALFVAIGGPAVAADGFSAAKKLVTTKQIKDGTIALKDLSPATISGLQGNDGAPGAQGPQGPQGAQGPPGTSGSPDTAAQVLAKLLTVDGSGSELDADRLDGSSASAFATVAAAVLDSDSATGDLAGSLFSNLQLAVDSVGASEIATDAVRPAEIQADAVRTAEILDGEVDTADLQDGSVTIQKLKGTGSLQLGGFNMPSIPAHGCASEDRTSTSFDVGELYIPVANAFSPVDEDISYLPISIMQEDHADFVACNGTDSAIDPDSVTLAAARVAP